MRKYTNDELASKLYSCNNRLTNLIELGDDKFQATCIICGGHPIIRRHDLLNCQRRLLGCAVCSSAQIEKGINDIESQYPDIAKYYIDKQYTTTHSIGTNEKGLTECPICHHQRLILPHKIKTRRFFLSCVR